MAQQNSITSFGSDKKHSEGLRLFAGFQLKPSHHKVCWFAKPQTKEQAASTSIIQSLSIPTKRLAFLLSPLFSLVANTVFWILAAQQQQQHANR